MSDLNNIDFYKCFGMEWSYDFKASVLTFRVPTVKMHLSYNRINNPLIYYHVKLRLQRVTLGIFLKKLVYLFVENLIHLYNVISV